MAAIGFPANEFAVWYDETRSIALDQKFQPADERSLFNPDMVVVMLNAVKHPCLRPFAALRVTPWITV
jgi:hypothetical protein